jgi:hypothetical protein
MRRRRYLTTLAAGGLAGLAGCTAIGGSDGGNGSGGDSGGSGGSDGSSGSPTDTPEGTATDASESGTETVNGVEVPVPDSELRRGAAKDAIPAIVDPEFGEDWSGVEVNVGSSLAGGGGGTTEPRLSDSHRVIAVGRDGEARAYPLRILNWHEVVNDTFGGPLLVTYCPLCGSGVTAVRTVGGEAATFGVSGLLFRNALVMYDRATGSRWSQIAAAAIQGRQVGTALELVPSALTTWGEFREQYPGGVVLRPPPDSSTVNGRNATRDYNQNPYAGYESSEQIGLGGSFDDDRLHPKTTVVGVEHGDVSRAYPLERVREAGVVNDEVDGLPVVVAATESGTLAAYVREVDGETVTFERESEAFLAAVGSRWRLVSGLAVDGPHEGTRLEQANTVVQEFFFSWKSFHPETEIWSAG